MSEVVVGDLIPKCALKKTFDRMVMKYLITAIRECQKVCFRDVFRVNMASPSAWNHAFNNVLKSKAFIRPRQVLQLASSHEDSA